MKNLLQKIMVCSLTLMTYGLAAQINDFTLESVQDGEINIRMYEHPNFGFMLRYDAEANRLRVISEELTDGKIDRMVIERANGNVGIGANNPATQLHVKGNAELLRLDGLDHQFLAFNNNSLRRAWMGFGNSTTKDFTINNREFGKFIIRTSTNDEFFLQPDGKLHATNLGNIGDHKDMQYDEVTGEIGWDNSSRRYKTNITTLQDDWTKIFRTRPVKYSRPDSPQHWEYGYIAEEVDSIGLTNLVGYDIDGIPDDVKYDRMVLYLTEIVKQQQHAIDQLTLAVDDLQEGANNFGRSLRVPLQIVK